MITTCSASNHCSFRGMTEVGFVCSYAGYCDFQLPRDSRNNITLTPDQWIKDNIVDKDK